MRIFLVEKYAIARDVTPFEKDAQARDTMLFEDARPPLVFDKPLIRENCACYSIKQYKPRSPIFKYCTRS